LLYHCYNGCTNEPQCKVIRTLPVLCKRIKTVLIQRTNANADMMLTGPIRNSDICYTRVHLLLTAQVRFLRHYYQQTEPESCPHSAQRAGQSPQQNKHNNNRRTSNDKSPDELLQIHFEILQPDYCAVKRPPPPAFYSLCEERLMLNKSETELSGFELSFTQFRIADPDGRAV
jgi:hypothetical protein